MRVMQKVSKFFVLLFVVLFGTLTVARAVVYTPATVPDPKRFGQDYYVSNPDTILTDSVVQWLNNCAVMLYDSTKVEMAVVALDSIGDADAFEFSFELFQRWGIGGAGRNTGVLILFVLSSHDLQIRTGTGIEGVLTDGRCSDIMRNDMFPAFKEGDYGRGLCLGALDIYETCTDGDAPEELLTIRSVTNRGKYADASKEEDNDATSVIAIVIVTFLFALPFLLGVLFQGKNQDTMAELKQRRNCLIYLIIGCLCFPFLIPAALWFWWRSKRMRCPQCGKNKYKHLSTDKLEMDDLHYRKVFHFQCSACGYTHDETELITRSVGGGSGGYYGGDDYDSGSSWDSDSGGSWGGGSTSGGGAGGKW